MSSHTIAGRFRAALPLLTLVLLGAAPAALPRKSPATFAESYRVLTTTYYERVDPQALLAAASDALSDLAKKHGVTVPPPQLRVEPDTEATLAGLDSAIAGVADEANGSPTDYAYAAIAAMAHAVGDKYTQFFTPDEFRQFNSALDPEKISGIGVMLEQDADTNVRVMYVVPTTPADRAGVHSGDVIVAIDGSLRKGSRWKTQHAAARQSGNGRHALARARRGETARRLDQARRTSAADRRLQDVGRQHRLHLRDGVR